MIDEKKIEQFYRDVDSLKLKFPVTDIAKKTGESKGNVSQYLNKKLSPSETFIEKFYKCFKITANSGTSSIEGDITIETIRDLAKSGAIQSEANRLQAEANRLQASNNSGLIEILKITAGVHSENHKAQNVGQILAPYLYQMANAGVEKKLWKTTDEGLIALGKLLVEDVAVAQK